MLRESLLVPLASLLAGACGNDPPKFTRAQTLGGVEVSAEVLNAGHRSYQMRCASCHGNDGSGQGPAAMGLAQRPRDFRSADFAYGSVPDGGLPSDEDLDIVIRNGKINRGMPAFGGLSDADRHAIIQYLKTFSPRWNDPVPSAEEAS